MNTMRTTNFIFYTLFYEAVSKKGKVIPVVGRGGQ
jgi:hypothetical protein